MRITIDKTDALNLVKGTGGPGTYKYANTRYGKLTGFPNERWEWNDRYLNDLSVEKLYDLYLEIKKIQGK